MNIVLYRVVGTVKIIGGNSVKALYCHQEGSIVAKRDGEDFMRLAIVGATGQIGQAFIALLHSLADQVKPTRVHAVASSRSAERQ